MKRNNKTYNIFKSIGIVLAFLYAALLVVFVYMTTMYNIFYTGTTNKIIFGVIYSSFSFVVLMLMIMLRKEKLIALLANILIIIYLPLLLLNFGDWLLIIPPAIVVLFSFIFSDYNETAKTIMTTIVILLYVFGIVGFYAITNLLMTRVSRTVVEEVVSPEGKYRYVLYDVENTSKGKTELYVEPNDKDISTKLIYFEVKGYEKCVKQLKYGERLEDIVWQDDNTLLIKEKGASDYSRIDIPKIKYKFTLD